MHTARNAGERYTKMKTKERPDVYIPGAHYLDSSAGSPPAILNEIWRAIQHAKQKELEIGVDEHSGRKR